MESVPGSENQRREHGGSVAWTVAAVLTVVACIVYLASGGGRNTPPAMEQPLPRATPEKTQKAEKSQITETQKKQPVRPDTSSTQARDKPPAQKPSELEAARQRLEELAMIYLPEAPAYREQLARVRALEAIEREHAGEPRELKKARVELAVAVARGLGDAHPKVVELKARIEEFEARKADDR